MRVYLVQHGKALGKEENPDRPLTDEGREEVRRVADRLAPMGLTVGRIVHSGKTRARQTAEILAQAVQSPTEAAEREGLSPNDPVDPIAYQLQDTADDVMIVGHLPFLGRLVSRLLGADADAGLVTFFNGGVVALERTPAGAWTLVWAAPPEVLG